MPSKEYNLLPVHPIAQGPIWLCGCNLSSLRQKIIHFPLWVRTFWSPTIPTKMHPLNPFYVWVVFPLRTYFISFSLCSFRNDGFICILLICIYLYIAPWEMWISPLFQMRYAASPINYKLLGSRDSLGTFLWSGFLVCHLHVSVWLYSSPSLIIWGAGVDDGISWQCFLEARDFLMSDLGLPWALRRDRFALPFTSLHVANSHI